MAVQMHYDTDAPPQPPGIDAHGALMETFRHAVMAAHAHNSMMLLISWPSAGCASSPQARSARYSPVQSLYSHGTLQRLFRALSRALPPALRAWLAAEHPCTRGA